MKIDYAAVMVQLLICTGLTLAGDIEKQETITKTLHLDPGGRERMIVVDNFFGPVSITGTSGNAVRMIARRTVTARTERDLQRAMEEVYLDITEEDRYIEIYVDGPFRLDQQGTRPSHWSDETCSVTYAFEIQVPENVSLEVKTVMNGDITIDNVHGDYNVRNINGSIYMTGMAGSGEVRAVNGNVELDFRKNPADDCRFGSLNGNVHMHFQAGLSADFFLKTFNGDFFTDFNLRTIPEKVKISDKRNHRRVYKAERFTGVRAGRGGPEIFLDGFNGNMYILKKGRG